VTEESKEQYSNATLENNSESESENILDTLHIENSTELSNQSLSNNQKLHPSELEHIAKLRKKIRIMDPASIYKYRHVELSLFNSIIQSITLFVSTILFLIFHHYFLSLSSIEIEGIGETSSLTIVGKIALYSPFFIIFTSFKELKRNLKSENIPQYWLAMLSNSMNSAIFNNIKLLSIPALIYIGCRITLEHYNSYSFEYMDDIFDGVTFDIASVAIAFLSIFIFCLSFRFCFKELK